MKKLMTMIAAVATAFGLYATEGFKAGTCFNEWTSISDRTGDENLTWSESLYESTLINPAGWSFGKKDLPKRWADNDASNALSIKTALGTEFVTCAPDPAIAPTGDEKIYVDALVKFTAFDEVAQFEDSNAKIAVWIREMYEDDGETVSGTNIYVTAGKIDSEFNITKENYLVGEYEGGDWCRLTIKSLGSVKGDGSGVYGFVVYIDGNPVSCATDKGLGYVTLSDLAAYYNANNILFPSLAKGTEISSLAISGQGAIDDIAFTTEAPDFAVDMLKATIELNDVTAAQLGTITVSTNGAEISGIDLSSGSAAIYYKKTTPSVPPTIKVEWTGAGNVLAGNAESSTGALTINESNLTYAKVYIGSKGYETFAKAMEAATDGQTITLSNNIAEVTITKNVTVDLAGNTIEATAGEEEAPAAITANAGTTVTIVDTADVKGTVNGDVKAATEEETGDLLATISITADATFNGEALTVASINAGKFKKDLNESRQGECRLTKVGHDGYKWAVDASGNYWELKPITYATLTVMADEGITYTLTNKTTQAIVQNGYQADIDNAEEIEAIDIEVATPGYTLDLQTSVTTTTLNSATPTAISLEKKALNYEITFAANGGSGNQDTISYTWGAEKYAPACTFTAPEKGTFNCWSNATDGVTYAVGATLPTERESYELVADWTIEQGGVPVDPADQPKSDAGRANLKALNEALGDDAAAWAEDVYGAGNTVPGSKLDDSTPELIKAAAEYNLKVMASPVTVAVVTAEDGGFTFTLTDAGDANPVVLKTKAQKLIKYSASLEDGGDFAPSTEETVTAEVSNDCKVSAKFTGKDDSGKAANAGFMKVDLSVAE